MQFATALRWLLFPGKEHPLGWTVLDRGEKSTMLHTSNKHSIFFSLFVETCFTFTNFRLLRLVCLLLHTDSRGCFPHSSVFSEFVYRACWDKGTIGHCLSSTSSSWLSRQQWTLSLPVSLVETIFCSPHILWGGNNPPTREGQTSHCPTYSIFMQASDDSHWPSHVQKGCFKNTPLKIPFFSTNRIIPVCFFTVSLSITVDVCTHIILVFYFL